MIVDQKVNKQYAGVYLLDGCVDGAQLATIKKKNGFQRVCARLFLGWVWVSIAKLKSNFELIPRPISLWVGDRGGVELAMDILGRKDQFKSFETLVSE